MRKLNLAIIGQGRSGKRIHGGYYLSERNTYYNVKYVVDADEIRRGIAKEQYPDCTVFADYHELFNLDDVDLVVVLVGHSHLKENMDKLSGKIVLDTRNICSADLAYQL